MSTQPITDEEFKVLDEAWGHLPPDPQDIPDGSYSCEIIKSKLMRSDKKGTPGLKLKYRVLDGPFKGAEIPGDIWLTEATMKGFKRTMQNLGVTLAKPSDLPMVNFVGLRCEVVIERDAYGPKVKWINPTQTVAESPNADFVKQIQNEPASPMGTDDDIPF